MSQVEVDKIIPQSGTTLTIGDSGDTITIASGATITTADNSHALELISTDADANVGPRLSLYRNSASPADNDILGDIRFMAEDDASAKLEFAKIEAKALDVSSGSRDTQLRFQIRHADSGNDILKLTPTEAVFNDGSFDTDFRIESNNNANMLFVNAGTDRVGIGTSSPDAMLHIHDDGASTSTHSYTKLHLENDDHLALQFSGSTVGEQWIWFADDTTATPVGGITYYHGGPYMGFRVEGAERMRIDSSGNFMVGKTTSNYSSPGVEAKQNGNLIAVRDSGNVVNFIRNTNDGSIVTFAKDTTNFASIGVKDGNNLTIDGLATNHCGIEFDGGSYIPRRNSATADNLIDLGTTSKRFAHLYLGGGVFLGGTGTANELDDYEEGTFNVTFTGSNSGSFAFSNAGRYTKIGRLVTISVAISNQAFGSYSGNLQFSLPFTSGINTYYGGDAYYYPQANWDNVSNFIGFTPNAPPSSNIGLFQLKTLEGDRQASLTNSNTNTSGQSGLYTRFSLTYATA